MTDQSYPIAVQRALDELPPGARTAALAQLPFARGLDDQLTVVTDAWLRCAAGSNATDTTRWIANCRRREALDNRRAGRAVEFMDDSLPFGLGEPILVEQDPMAGLLAAEAAEVYQEGLRAAGIAVDAAPATIELLQSLPVEETARRCRRSLRAVQSHMRWLLLCELAGQLTLPRVPCATEVFRARGLGVYVGKVELLGLATVCESLHTRMLGDAA